MNDRDASTSRRCLRAGAGARRPARGARRLRLEDDARLAASSMAADELEAWELSRCATRKNWARLGRPAPPRSVGSGAAVGLVVLRTRRQRHAPARQSANGALDLAERTLRDVAREARRVFDDAALIRSRAGGGVRTRRMPERPTCARSPTRTSCSCVRRGEAARVRGRLRAPLRRRLLARLPDGRHARRRRGRRAGGVPLHLALRRPLRPRPRLRAHLGARASSTTARSTRCGAPPSTTSGAPSDEGIEERFEARRAHRRRGRPPRRGARRSAARMERAAAPSSAR